MSFSSIFGIYRGAPPPPQPTDFESPEESLPSPVPKHLIAQATPLEPTRVAPIPPSHSPLGPLFVSAVFKGDEKFIENARFSPAFDEIDSNHLGTALLAAIELKNGKILTSMAACRLLPKIEKNVQIKALDRAIELDCEGIARTLLRSRSGSSGEFGALDPLLSKAAGFGRVDIMNSLLLLHNKDEISGVGMRLALYRAIANKHLPIIRTLVSSELFPHLPADEKRGYLKNAVETGDPDITQCLVDLGFGD